MIPVQPINFFISFIPSYEVASSSVYSGFIFKFKNYAILAENFLLQFLDLYVICTAIYTIKSNYQTIVSNHYHYMKNIFFSTPSSCSAKNLFALFFIAALFFVQNTMAQVSVQNLLVNGDFESGGSGTGFQTQSPYNAVVPSGSSNAGDYAIVANPQLVNNAFFISGTDHSGLGKTMVIDGTTVGGQQRFWKAGNTGGGVGPLTIGLTYTFSYWIKNIATSSVDVATTPDIGVAWNNANTVTLVAGSGQVSFPGSSAVWQKVVYSFVPTSAFVNIELYNNNTNGVGNDFALDDLEVLPPATPLTINFAVINPNCPTSSDGFIAAFATGGTPPYLYSLNGGPFISTTGLFSGLAASTNNYVAVIDANTPIPDTAITTATIDLIAPVNPLVVRSDTSICAPATVRLSVTGGNGIYLWTASPFDITLIAPASANPTVAPTVTTTYTASSTYSRTLNFVFNGNFSLGNIGFNSDYLYLPFNPLRFQSVYGIVTNANTFESTFSNLCVDHTNGTGNMFVADGSTNSNKKVWQQTIPVLPATNYTFSYWIQTVATPNPANIETQINGQPITGTILTSTALAPSTTCTWVQQSYSWNSGANTTAEIALYNRNTTISGNDFALDDINFSIPIGIICPLQKSVVVTVNNGGTPPNVSFSYNSPVCVNSAINPSPILTTGFANGGTFSSTAGLSINATTGEINLASSTPGTYLVKYLIPSSGCSSTVTGTATIVINGITPAVTGFSYTTPVCVVGTNPSPILAPNFIAGGTFTCSSANLSINAATGIINLAASVAGTYTITYSVAASSCNTAGSSITAITLNATQTPVTGFSYTTPICITSTNPSPIPSSANFTTGGVYTSTAGVAINATTGVINLSASTAGVYQINYTVAATGCFSTAVGQANIAILANNPIVTGFSYATPVCANNTNPLPITNAGFTSGGIFSSTPGLSVNATNGLINLNTSSAGSYMVMYSIAPTVCNPLSSSTAPIVIQTVPAPPATSPGSRCGSGIVLLRANGSSTLNWYSDVLLTNKVASGNTYSPTLSTDTTFYVTDSNATCTSLATAITATINPVPNKPNLGRDTAICTGEKIILNAGIYNTYTWQDGTTSSILTATTTGNYIVTVNDGGVCNNADSIAINVLPNCDDVYFPSGFSPNADGTNETFGPFGNVFFIKNYNCRVFNRFGQIVFSTNNPYQRWDGIYAGKPLAPGNYVFVATYKFKNVDKKQKGNIVLLR